MGPIETIVLKTLYEMGEKVEHRHDHVALDLVRRLANGGLRERYIWEALQELKTEGLVEYDGVRVKALPAVAAAALGLVYIPPLVTVVPPRSRLRLSALAG
jgi:hypothetical protein